MFKSTTSTVVKIKKNKGKLSVKWKNTTYGE